MPRTRRSRATDHDYTAARNENDDATVQVIIEEENTVAGHALNDITDVEEVTTEQVVVADPQADAEVVSYDVVIVEGAEAIQEAPPQPGPSTGAAVAGDDDDVILVQTPSPSAKKRKRHSMGTPKGQTPRMKAPGDGNGGADDEDDGLTCPICLDTWEMSGEHRLVSLKCGHLFGDSCIRRWLTESGRQTGIKVCPQCKTKAANRDIRCLYAKRLRAIDRSEEHRMREQLGDERRRMQTTQTELATIKMSFAMILNKVQTLESENDRMKLILRTGGGASGYGCDFKSGDDPMLLKRLQSYKLFMTRNIEISREPGCRVILYSEHQSAMIVTQKSAQSLFPGYGLRFIDTPSFKPSSFLHTSGKLLRDICLSADQQMLAVASMETTTKLFDLRTRQVAATFTPSERTLWACAMDKKERDQLLYIGAQHGSTYLYDVRNPETVVDEFKTDGDLSPVINIAPVSVSKMFPFGGFLVCKLQSLWFYEISSASGTATATRLSVEGPFISMNYDAGYETILLSARNSTRFPQSRYIIGKLDIINGIIAFIVKVSFNGSKTTPVMTRCSQIAVEENTLVAGYLQDVKQLALFDVRRAQRVQSLPVTQDIVYDMCPVYLANATYLAALTESKCRIYEVTPTS